MDKQILAAFAIIGVLTASLIGLSVYQNFCANRAKAEVARVVEALEESIQKVEALVTTSEKVGVEPQSEAQYPESLPIFEAETFKSEPFTFRRFKREAEAEAEGEDTFGRFRREAEAEAEGEDSFGRFRREAEAEAEGEDSFERLKREAEAEAEREDSFGGFKREAEAKTDA